MIGQRGRGVALVAVLALLACVAMLMLATLTAVTVNWLAARNLREGTLAWSRAESASTAAVAALGEAYRREGELPDAFDLAGLAEMQTTLAYTRLSRTRATIDVVGSFGRAAVRQETVVDMAR